MSDHLARASARKRAGTPRRTKDETTTEHGPSARPSRTPLTAEDRAAIRKAGAEDARLSRVGQGLPDRIEDPAAIAVLAGLLRAERKHPKP
jgi:hypothetical protein